ncbi:MAG: hypothetical protein AVDCRST_MAG96-545 [uncultured Segetibacter sp.]|uniref:Uncharacterized protein n=1 Tax=uncultured Segetibacter sp. TaxID=481133 RepID=A0A6J4RGU8_9BACT|nr:MAG: hypothetical protein AVDCRST_MAG96-545 [uncultured Segetibacter sp.]
MVLFGAAGEGSPYFTVHFSILKFEKIKTYIFPIILFFKVERNKRKI